MSEGRFDDAEVEFPCPKCDQKEKQTVGWLRERAETFCVGCGAPVRLDKDFSSGLSEIDHAMEHLRRAFRKLGK